MSEGSTTSLELLDWAICCIVLMYRSPKRKIVGSSLSLTLSRSPPGFDIQLSRGIYIFGRCPDARKEACCAVSSAVMPVCRPGAKRCASDRASSSRAFASGRVTVIVSRPSSPVPRQPERRERRSSDILRTCSVSSPRGRSSPRKEKAAPRSRPPASATFAFRSVRASSSST